MEVVVFPKFDNKYVARSHGIVLGDNRWVVCYTRGIGFMENLFLE